jgi:hypothetical protein
MSVSILIVDNEPDVAELFRQRFSREKSARHLRAAFRDFRRGGAGPSRRPHPAAAAKRDAARLRHRSQLRGRRGRRSRQRPKPVVGTWTLGLDLRPDADFKELRMRRHRSADSSRQNVRKRRNTGNPVPTPCSTSSEPMTPRPCHLLGARVSCMKSRATTRRRAYTIEVKGLEAKACLVPLVSLLIVKIGFTVA